VVMSFDDLVITGMKTAEGERFLIGARARGELGLTEQDINRRFEAARKLISSVTESLQRGRHDRRGKRDVDVSWRCAQPFLVNVCTNVDGSTERDARN
jgi:hypothetical protein